MQWLNTLERNNKLVQKKFRNEMRFSQPGDSGEKLLDWYHSTVIEIFNKKKRSVKIKLDDYCLHDNDMKFSTNMLLISIWIQKIPLEGSWREYLTSECYYL